MLPSLLFSSCYFLVELPLWIQLLVPLSWVYWYLLKLKWAYGVPVELVAMELAAEVVLVAAVAAAVVVMFAAAVVWVVTAAAVAVARAGSAVVVVVPAASAAAAVAMVEVAAVVVAEPIVAKDPAAVQKPSVAVDAEWK